MASNRPRTRRLPPIALAVVVAPLATALGIWGYARAFHELSVTDVVYRSLQLFTVDAQVPPQGTPWQLDIARFMAPLAVVYAAVVAAIALLRGRYDGWWVRFLAKDHVVVVGLGDTGVRVVRGLRQGGKSRTVVTIELDPRNPNVSTARSYGGRVVIADATSGRALELARIDRASQVVVVTGDDSLNLEVAAVVLQQESILPAGAANPMLPTYDSTDGTQTADGFRMPDELVRVFAAGLAVMGIGEEISAAPAGEHARPRTPDSTGSATGGADGVAEDVGRLNPDQQVAALINQVAKVREVRSEHRGYVSIAPLVGRGIALYVHRSRISIALPPERAEGVLRAFPAFAIERKSPATTYVVVHAAALRDFFDGALGLALEAIDWRSGLHRPAPILGAAPRANAGDSASLEDVVVVAARSAYGEYLEASAYVCQPGRSFRSSVRRIGFYFDRLLRREVPAILHIRDAVPWTLEHADQLRRRGEEHDAAIAHLIEISFRPGSIWFGQRPNAGYRDFKVLLLSPPSHDDTVLLPEPLHHAGASAFTMGQRYVDEEQLLRASSTDDL